MRDSMATVTMSLEEYESLMARLRALEAPQPTAMVDTVSGPRKRVNRAYARRYKRAFKQIAPRYKMKSGKWKKDGFRKTVRAAHKEAKR